MIRLSLLLSAALLLTAQVASAQTYETGSQTLGEPRSAAQFGDVDGADFTALMPAQIADDVTTAFHPRTGEKEWIAPTFDPFEDDDELAATVNLRSTAGARDLNGDTVTDGALLDISLFYTDVGDRRFGLTRDAIFLNGDPVPTTLRDSRELECSSRVTERVYQYDRYDNSNASRHIWIRPHYRGHRGFAYGGFGGSWGGYGTVRPRSRNNRRFQSRDDVRRPPRGRSGTTPGPRQDTNRATPTPYYPHSDPRLDGGDVIRPRPRGAAPRRTGSQTSRVRSDVARDNPRVTEPPRLIAPDLRQTLPRGQRRNGSARSEPRRDANPTPRARDQAEPRSQPRSEPRPQQRPAQRVDPRPAPRAERRPAPTPRPRSTEASTPAPTPRPRPVPKPRAAPKRPQQRSNPSERSRVVHDMFPGDGYADAVVVQSQRDCAREDQLSLFIPNDRLEAARFDGLTLILRDVTFDPKTGQTTVYDECPLYIPPNYIEGFRLALPQS